VHINAWQTRNDEARKADQRILNKQLRELERNQQRMMETLSKLDRPALGIPTNPFVIDMHQDNVMAMMVSLQRRLDHISDGDQERQFFSHALRYLITTSGRQVEMESWMITSYEVEFGPRIGSGGLYVFLLVSVSSALCPPGL
jgi:hypothetical protein